MSKKLIFTTIGLILVLFILTGCISRSDEPRITQAPTPPPTQLLKDLCEKGFTYYTSIVCPRGQECGAETGDLLCHQNCTTNADCPAGMPVCQEIYLARGDVIEPKQFCIVAGDD